MKKVLVSIILLFIPMFINAKGISKLYIDSEIDISGNLLVKEIVSLPDDCKDPVNLYYKNDIAKKYEGTTLIIRKVGILDDIKNISSFYDDDFYDKHVNETKSFIEYDDREYVNIVFPEKNVYYIEYVILNLCVKYNDASELYYRYLYNFNYDIDDGVITFRMPIKSKLFNTFVHSNSNVKAKVDKEKNILTININNFNKENYLDTRILFDKDIFSININKDKVLNENILNKIRVEEISTYIYKLIIYLLIAFFILIIISIIYCYIKLDTVYYNITSSKIDKNIKILVLSDIHDRKSNNRIVKIVKKVNPDYVILSGDLIDGRYINKSLAMRNIRYMISLFKKLKDYNLYYTFGNHETYLSSEMFKKYKKLLAENQVELLNNKNTFISDNIKLGGIFYEVKYYNKKKHPITDKFIKDKMGVIDKKNFNIIINHNPLIPEPFSKYGYDLMISGHVHGGIARIPFALLSPEYKFFPKYSNGLYEIGKMKLLVSRGIGFSKIIPFRINNPGHIMVINLTKE